MKEVKRTLNYNNPSVTKADTKNYDITTCCEVFKKKMNEIFTTNQFTKLNTDIKSN